MQAGFWRGLSWLSILLLLVSGTVACFSALPTCAQAPPADRVVRVVTRQVAPFVLKKGDALTGFSMELWAALAEATGVKAKIEEVGTLPELLAAVRDDKADLAIAAISITSQREKQFDFSQPMFESGLQVMVRADAGAGAISLAAAGRMAMSGPMRGLLGFLLALIVIVAHLIWFFERRHFHDRGKYFPGIFRAMYWATGAAGSQQPFHPHSPLGRLVGAFCVFVSVIVVAYFTATVTTAMTVEQLKGDINGPDDLVGKKVGSVVGSTSARFLDEAGLKTKAFAQISEAFDALEAGLVDAMVFDAPVLLYRAANEGKGKVSVVGPVFRHESHGILFAPGSPLRKPINEALLKLRESGQYDTLYRTWFGAAQGGA